jgi:hypothetical protein
MCGQPLFENVVIFVKVAPLVQDSRPIPKRG